METKLFNIEPQKREVIFYLQTYKGNRIAIKLLKFLEAGDIFTVSPVGDKVETRIFEISIFTDIKFEDSVIELKSAIVKLLHHNTPENYLFDLKERRLGFVNSFNVFSDKGFHFEVCHKIKEKRTDGGTAIPANKITI